MPLSSENASAVYPETLVFIGAGATASLKAPTTAEQDKLICMLCGLGRFQGKSLDERFENTGFNNQGEPSRTRIKKFIQILGDDISKDFLTVSDSDYEIVKSIYRSAGIELSLEKLSESIIHLRRTYDWNALRHVAMICPFDAEEMNGDGSYKLTGNLIRFIYSILDKKIMAHQGLKIQQPDGRESVFIEHGRLQGARNCLTMLISLLFACSWESILNDKEKLTPYIRFAEGYTRLMQEESLRFAERGYDLSSRRFYLNTSAFVSLNFEAIFLWIFYIANDRLNKSAGYIGNPPRPVKQYMEFGSGISLRDKGAPTEKQAQGRLSCDESSASRINKEGPGRCYQRLERFYFAHGSCHWRECPVCGKLSVYLGDRWEYYSRTLFPPFPVDFFGNERRRDSGEEKARTDLKEDRVSCLHCGHLTETADAPMIMQTLFKNTPTSFLEEIQRSVKVHLMSARHIVLLGYSLPPDDTLWQQTFAEAVHARCRDEDTRAFCSVVVGRDGPQRWLYDAELSDYLEKLQKGGDLSVPGTIRSAWRLFGRSNVRAYIGGIPRVWNDASREDLIELFYPSRANWKGTRVENEFQQRRKND